MFDREISAGQRFEFGKNWRRFLRTMDDERLAESERALTAMLGDIQGKTFLDVGCGSGLSSLAAHRLGAKVQAFDYDPQSVACTKELQRMYGCSWPVEEGSALDAAFLGKLGKFDIVYSWGVLHHTGDMWKALDNVASLAKEVLFIAIYNDQGRMSRLWTVVKKLYNRHASLRPLIIGGGFLFLRIPAMVRDTFTKGKPLAVFARKTRGMSAWYDLIDWVGGYPFEVAKPEEIFRFYRDRGFSLSEMTTVAGNLGCNQFVFHRSRS